MRPLCFILIGIPNPPDAVLNIPQKGILLCDHLC